MGVGIERHFMCTQSMRMPRRLRPNASESDTGAQAPKEKKSCPCTTSNMATRFDTNDINDAIAHVSAMKLHGVCASDYILKFGF